MSYTLFHFLLRFFNTNFLPELKMSALNIEKFHILQILMVYIMNSYIFSCITLDVFMDEAWIGFRSVLKI